ncbi:Der GTPase-activating protein YihI [Pseudoalteromonas tunicata]|uniref:Der GTPase-activating protein YihI n=1 Tax=Pseudoalteromonas tunicata TaxID=314281 RepID=UPI0027402235|nr:Der GTPase-activating protein YihI [Pseudoalteromonas tunicata]MDP4985266.1 Der GTPase-activating protein YihI [Pseudoalteromonas tunicata]
MSRTKTRKGGSLAPKKLSKDKLKEMRALKEVRAKAKTGNKPGTRNAVEGKNSQQETNVKKDSQPGKGSKKPVSLVAGAAAVIVPEPVLKRHLEPQVELKKVAPVELSPEQELEQLENDQRLLDLIDRHESGELLVGKDAKYFNTKIARHQALCELLGIEDEDDDEQGDDLYSQFLSNNLADEWLDDDEDDK